MTKEFDVVVYEMPLDDGITPAEVRDVVSHFQEDEELYPVEVSDSNTFISGYARLNLNLEEILARLVIVCNSTELPQDGIIKTESGYLILVKRS